MTVIKFTDENKPNYVLKPGINSTVSNVFTAIVRYATKEKLPKSADRDELIFTTDTHEFFRGNGKGLDLIPFNSVLLFESFDKFPSEGIDTKIYVDKQSSIMFYWNGSDYQTLSSGDGGEIIVSPNDKRVGELGDLKTTDKTTVVAAINEVFSALAVIDVDSILKNVSALETDIDDIKDSLANLDLTAIAGLEAKIGSLNSLTTAEKTSIVGAINELKTLIAEPAEVDLSEIMAMIGTLSLLSTTNKTDVVSAINEVFAKADGNATAIADLLKSINDLKNKETEVNGKIAVIENSITVLQTSVTELNASIDKVNSAMGSLEALTTTDKATVVAAINELVGSFTGVSDRLTSLEGVSLTEEDKQKYKEYSDLVQSLLDGMVPELQDRISMLEHQVTALQNQTENPGNGGETPGTEQELWSFDFKLPVGYATYELGDDPKWVSSGNAFDIEKDLVGDVQKVFLYSLGSDSAPTEPTLVPFMGTEGKPPTSHGYWESYTNTDVIFQVASLIAWNFRLVKYA